MTSPRPITTASPQHSSLRRSSGSRRQDVTFSPPQRPRAHVKATTPDWPSARRTSLNLASPSSARPTPMAGAETARRRRAGFPLGKPATVCPLGQAGHTHVDGSTTRTQRYPDAGSRPRWDIRATVTRAARRRGLAAQAEPQGSLFDTGSAA
jgi:hypothetical protein